MELGSKEVRSKLSELISEWFENAAESLRLFLKIDNLVHLATRTLATVLVSFRSSAGGMAARP